MAVLRAFSLQPKFICALWIGLDPLPANISIVVTSRTAAILSALSNCNIC